MSSLLDELREALREQYEVESELGRGGMATVFLAADLKHGRRVAIKVLSPELSSSIDGDRFRREIQIAARLSHPHILPVFDSGEANGLLYYTMPFVEGESLRARLARESQLALDDAVAITCEVADALSYAHSLGVVHRDIKPENILLHGGHAVVADFGIARILQDAGNEKLTQTGMSIGTAAYMSPEQFTGEHVDGRSDEYSLACVLYEMLVGQVPFTGPNAMAIMARHTMESVPSIRIVRGSVPEDLEEAILSALEKVPADRFATVAQFKEAVLGQGATSTYARRTRGQAPPPASGAAPVTRRRRTLLYGAVAIGLLGAGSLAGRYYWVHDLEPMPVRQAGALGLDPRRVAVLYLEDDSRNHNLGYLADGLTESLIGDLERVKGLDVVSDNGVSPFHDSAAPLDSIAGVLKAGTLVRGSVEAMGDRVRVTVRLVDGNSGAEYKRAAFEKPKSDALAARDSLAQQVAFFLRERLGDEIRLRSERTGTTNPNAWAVLQQGERADKDARALFLVDSAAASAHQVRSADSLYAEAGRLDPAWATPAAHLARFFSWRVRTARNDLLRRQLIDSGLAAAESALARDPKVAEGFELRGTLHYYRRLYDLAPDPTEYANLLRTSESDLRKAVELDPQLASAWSTLSAVLYQKQNKVEANLAARRAYEADAYLANAPAIIWRLYATSYDLEQFVDAVQWCDLGHRRYPADPKFVACRLWLATTDVAPPNIPDAWRALAELQQRTPASEWATEGRSYQMLVAVPIAKAGLRDSANRVIERARAGRDVDPRDELVGQEAIVRALIGDRTEALRLLRVYLTSHPEHREGLMTANTWWWRSLQDDPRFKRMIAVGQ
ncbi:MAG TPA: protein kinase [Gemmatimonadaceae bacterium]|nr:protein kinase [Gemmatimonadaceae bacterium]